jgi:hypothetical protein
MTDDADDPNEGGAEEPDDQDAGPGFPTAHFVLSESAQKALDEMGKAVSSSAASEAMSALRRTATQAMRFNDYQPLNPEVFRNPVADNTSVMRDSLESMVEFMGKLVEMTEANIAIAKQAQADTAETAKFTKTTTKLAIGISVGALLLAAASLVVSIVHP